MAQFLTGAVNAVSGESFIAVAHERANAVYTLCVIVTGVCLKVTLVDIWNVKLYQIASGQAIERRDEKGCIIWQRLHSHDVTFVKYASIGYDAPKSLVDTLNV